MPNPLMAGLLAAAVVWGCTVPLPASPPPSPAPPSVAGPSNSQAPANSQPPANTQAASAARYRCEHNIEFTVRFVDDSAVIDAGPRGSETLLRDAGGATPHQTVYSSARMRAEFGLGVSGSEAILRYALPPLVAHCVQQ